MLYLLNIFASFLFLFLFWGRLKEDYLSDQIFNSGIITLAGIVVGIIFTKFLGAEYWFWLSLTGALLGLVLASNNNKINFFELFDIFVASALPWLVIANLSSLLNDANYASIIWTIFALLLIFIFIFVEKRYKGFSWYRSGKIGFAGLFTIGVLFLIRVFVDFIPVQAVSFIRYDFVLSLVAAVASFSMLFARGNR